ncbi:MAG: squalene synthase HpnC [Phycisphaeraceae bacterium]
MSMGYAVIDQLPTFGPDRCERLSYEQATRYTRALTRSHYENFTVASWLLPRHLRDPFSHVYAFCRWADDLGDETGDPARSLELLAWWRSELDRCYAGEPRHPVFVAHRPTVEKYDIPRRPFDDLIDAFEQDQRVTRYETWDAVLDYCSRSADPVGRLVLYLCGYRDAERQRLSDQTCTALQLTNFWQDVRRDIVERGRVYIPAEVAGRHGLELERMVRTVQFDAGCERGGCRCGDVPDAGIRAALPAYRATLNELVERTWPMFAEGRQLWPRVSPDVRLDIRLFTLGGEAILRRIERRGYDTLTARPRLGRAAKLGLLLQAVAGRLGVLVRPSARKEAYE